MRRQMRKRRRKMRRKRKRRRVRMTWRKASRRARVAGRPTTPSLREKEVEKRSPSLLHWRKMRNHPFIEREEGGAPPLHPFSEIETSLLL